MSKKDAAVGVSDHGGWAILVTAGRDGSLLDRRRIELVDESLPKLPHHHDAQGLPMDEAVALVERVRVSAEKHAARALDDLARALPYLRRIALRQCQPLPPTIPERLTDYRSQNVADWVMYRRAIALAAESRGWPVFWYDTRTVLDQARQTLHLPDLDAHFAAVRKSAGPPWDKDHRLAMAAAIVAASVRESGP